MSSSLYKSIIEILKSSTWKTRPEPFEAFFREGLFFENDQAKSAAYCYLALADVFDFAPGLGIWKANTNTRANATALANACRKLAIGKFSGGIFGTNLELRIGEHLSKFETPMKAKKALTPARRDSLRMEANKLLQVPVEEWKIYIKAQKGTAIGVRG
jgi:hypothetical protein